MARTLATTGAVGLTAALGGRAYAADVDPGVLGKLRGRLKGRVIVPADAGYTRPAACISGTPRRSVALP